MTVIGRSSELRRRALHSVNAEQNIVKTMSAVDATIVTMPLSTLLPNSERSGLGSELYAKSAQMKAPSATAAQTPKIKSPMI